ncbi:anti-sigma-I factor RsgI family protein [Isachenkonia alkalipeptolytica]|uniref:Anti-sigma factor domain-containing protein n=1 Tax=Isachenkonia alkalipeptolytica TaxID=2565777 RepID=A0AA44BEG3_9CLOT|nr:anti-sigma factor domain-containing protein [Isachenkonia alkalipeptolytica]
MKKAYVMEVKEDHLLVMTEEQRFVRLRKKAGVDAGEEILFAESQVLDIPKANSRGENIMKKIKQVKPMGIAAAMVLLLVLSIFAITGGETEVQYLLGFDVNPGIQIEVGENEEVLRVDAMNEEAKSLEVEALEGESLEVFLEELLVKLEAQGHLNSETAQVMLSYADLLEDDVASEDFVDRVTAQMEEYFAEKNMNVEINMLLVDEENYENARIAGITLGKFQLIQEIERRGATEDPGEEPEGKETEGTEEAAEESVDEAGEEGDDITIDTEKYQDTPVRELLKHPVFERHPRDRNKEEGEHPVFDVHPRDWNKEDGDKPHPVFDEHPGNRGNDQDENGEDVDGENGQDPEEGRDEERGHPVFEEHPRDRNKEDGEHPVFDEHPRDRSKDEDRDSDEGSGDNDSGDGENENGESDQSRGTDEKREHPVFDNHPGSRGNESS